MRQLKFRTILSEHNASDYGLKCELPSKAKQSDRDMFNPNTVMKMFRRTGDISVFQKRKGYYADICHLSSMSSYADVQAAIEPIIEAFYTLPSLEREKFGHDPMKFLDFTKNPANLTWLAEQGFIDDPNLRKSKLNSPPTKGETDLKSDEGVAQ